MSWSQYLYDNDPWGADNDSSFGKRRKKQRPMPRFEEIIQSWQDKMSFGSKRGGNSNGGGNNDNGGGEPFRSFFGLRGIFVVLTLLLFIWLATGIYRVGPGQKGVELIFGALNDVTEPGLHYNPPSPFGQVILPEVDRSRRINVGYETLNDASIRDVPKQSFILTGDENIVDMDFTVFWKIRDPVPYLFNIRNPDLTIQLAAESVMREVVGQTSFDQTVTAGREDIEFRSRNLLQSVLDVYQSGVEVESLVLQKSDPPAEVIDAFNDVQRARQDRDRMRNEAEAYAYSVVPSARGQSEQMIRVAEAYRERLINESIGEAARFNSVLESYKNAPFVTRKRMYIETISRIMADADKIILDSKANGVVPILPLPELRGKQPPSTQDPSNTTP